MVDCRRFCLIAGLAMISVGCGPSGPTTQGAEEDEILAATESFRDFGDYVLHFNALTTDQISEAMAAEHGVIRSRNRALLNVSVLQNQEIGLATAVEAEVSASARNLTGQIRNLPVRPIRDGDAIYYIAETPIVNAESLIFTVEAMPDGSTETLSVSFQKQFFVDD
jgi:hypothetical protein